MFRRPLRTNAAIGASAISPRRKYRSCTWGIHFFSVLEIGLFVLDCAPRKKCETGATQGCWTAPFGDVIYVSGEVCVSLYFCSWLLSCFGGAGLVKMWFFVFKNIVIDSDFRLRFLRKYTELYLDFLIFKVKFQSSSPWSAAAASISRSSIHFK